MINWNVVPMWWGESLPYTLFTEMEWIGKLSYMCNDFATRLVTAEEKIDDFGERLDAAEYQINLNKSDIVSLTDRMDTAEGNINALKTRIETVIEIPTISSPVDDAGAETRTYTISLSENMEDSKYINVKFDYIYDGTFNYGDYRVPMDITIPIVPEAVSNTAARIISAVYNAVSPLDTTVMYTNAIKQSDGTNPEINVSLNGLTGTEIEIVLQKAYVAIISGGSGSFGSQGYPKIDNLVITYYK